MAGALVAPMPSPSEVGGTLAAAEDVGWVSSVERARLAAGSAESALSSAAPAAVVDDVRSMAAAPDEGGGQLAVGQQVPDGCPECRRVERDEGRGAD